MKKQILILVATLGFTFLLVGASVNAQTHGHLAANVPFDFYVGSQKFTSGEYIIWSADPQSSGATLVFHQKEGKVSRILILMPEIVNGERTEADPKLIFNRYGSEYFLSEVRNPAQNYGARSAPSKVEKNLARRFGSATPNVVAMNVVKIN